MYIQLGAKRPGIKWRRRNGRGETVMAKLTNPVKNTL